MKMRMLVWWFEITAWLYQDIRVQWVTKASRNPLYMGFITATSRQSYWMRLSYRDRRILIEFICGIAWGRYTNDMLEFMIDLISNNSQHDLLKQEPKP